MKAERQERPRPRHPPTSFSSPTPISFTPPTTIPLPPLASGKLRRSQRRLRYRIFEHHDGQTLDLDVDPRHFLSSSVVHGLISAASSSDFSVVESAFFDMESTASASYPHAQSVLGFLYDKSMNLP